MNADDAKRTVPLPAAPPTDERGTVPLPGADASTIPPDTSAHIGRFAVRRWVGAGAFGEVYRCHDPQLDREVAVKVAKPGSLNTPERLARFLREAKAAANLRHPHIVPLYETGTDGDRRFIVSAFIAGRTLEECLSPSPPEGEGLGMRGPTPLPLTQVADIGRKLADALAYAHSQGVVHRDVKPANVLVDAAGDPHLLDFGLAAREEEGGERLTQDGQGMGTPAYMAPEQADGKGEAASDQYSLGCTLYEMATGQTPFAGGPVQQMFLHQSQPVPSPRSLRPDIPNDLDTLILKCLEKEPARRYPNCSELADDLRRFASGEPVKVRRAGPVERLTRWARRNKKVAGMGLLTLLTMALGSGASLGFGLYANEQRRDAQAKTEEIEKEKAKAEDEKNNAIFARVETQRTLAKALLAPIQESAVPLSNFEEDTLWQMALLQDGPVPFLTLEQAVKNPQSAKQLSARSEYLFHATIGLNRRRAKVDEMIADSLRDPLTSAEQKTELAVAVVAAEQCGDSAERVVEVLVAALFPSEGTADLQRFTPPLIAACEHLTTDRKAEVLGRVADGMLTRLGTASRGYAQARLGLAIAPIIAKLPPEAADRVGERVAAALAQTLPKCGSPIEQEGVARALAEVVKRSPLTDGLWRITATETLAHVLKLTSDRVSRLRFAEHLATMSSCLPANRAAELLAQAVPQAKENGERGKLAEALASAAVSLSPSSAEKVCGPSADALVAELGKTTLGSDRRTLSLSLTALAERLPPERAGLMMAVATDGLAEAVAKEMTLFDLSDTVIALATVARFLPPERAVQVCERAADAIIAARSKVANAFQAKLLAVGMGALAGKLSTEKRAEFGGVVANQLAAGAEKPTDAIDLRSYAEGLVAISDMIPPPQAEGFLEHCADLVVRAVHDPKNRTSRYIASAALAAMAERIPMSKVEVVTATLIEVMGESSSEETWRVMGGGLAAVTSGLDTRQRTCVRSATPMAALAGVVTLHPHILPTPRPLPPQQLVELLKHPFCVKEARRAVLDALEFTYDRKFADLWEFVAFAEKEHPELDLLTSPKRPERILPKADAKPK